MNPLAHRLSSGDLNVKTETLASDLLQRLNASWAGRQLPVMQVRNGSA